MKKDIENQKFTIFGMLKVGHRKFDEKIIGTEFISEQAGLFEEKLGLMPCLRPLSNVLF